MPIPLCLLRIKSTHYQSTLVFWLVLSCGLPAAVSVCCKEKTQTIPTANPNHPKSSWITSTDRVPGPPLYPKACVHQVLFYCLSSRRALSLSLCVFFFRVFVCSRSTRAVCTLLYTTRTRTRIDFIALSIATMVKPCVLTGVALAAGIAGSGAFTGPALARGHVRPASTSSRSTNAW